MIPPATQSLLSANPQFANLHKTLTTKVLDLDASTRTTNSTHAPVAAQLNQHRVRVARDRILLGTLACLAADETDIDDVHNDYDSDDDTLPQPLRDLLALMVEYIPLSQSRSGGGGGDGPEDDLLAPDLHAFRRDLPRIARATAAVLARQHRRLVAAAAAVAAGSGGRAGGGQGEERDLATLLAAQTARLQTLRQREVPAALRAATDALLVLLRAQSEEVQRAVRDLEQRKHGAESRHVQARAAFLAGVAVGLERKCRVEELEWRRDGLGGKAVQERLLGRVGELEREGRELEGRWREVDGALKEYEVVGGEVMLRLGRRYAAVEAELEGVKADVERLLAQERGGESSEGSSWIH
ncbi:uncharacterized protein HMPREF1541_07597 [Cyphellophora europaea CBS 101466]|uniref:Uncharacterized protein n=1 Tax=Cyphellophora europaea (strain CBS 101466) TaxID=1220924 RepID=W2RQI3_CYPE1|nr:uncharacterized protein HMPREF1541_07597 [Cyphellophora europaea CBS 101466]ETN37974.1 hypothetical protein HMPREF1541_07597 [Cyphellophora europaea CBS 101466]